MFRRSFVNKNSGQGSKLKDLFENFFPTGVELRWFVVVIELPDRIAVWLLLFDVCHVVGAQEADHRFEHVAMILALVTGVSDFIEVVDVESLWNGNTKLESIHIWHLVIVPVDVNAQHFWKRLLDEMNLLSLLY